MKILRDAPELDAFDPTLKAGYTMASAEGAGYSLVFAYIWAFWVGGIGLVIVFGPIIWRLLCTIFPRINPS